MTYPYSQRIVRESGPNGASVLNALSGASINVQAGALLSVAGTLQTTGGQTFAGATCIPASSLKLAQEQAASAVIGIFEVFDFGNGAKFWVGRTQNAPSAAGSPGSLFLRLPGTGTPASAAALYIKQGDNSPASAGWQVFQTGASAG